MIDRVQTAEEAEAKSQVRRQFVALIVFYALLILTTLGPWMTYRPPPADAEGSPLRQASYMLLFLIAVMGVQPLKNPRRLWVTPIMLTIALGWCWLSLTWAIAPMVGMRRLILTTIVLWSAFLCVEQVGYQKAMQAIRITLCITLVANYIAVLLFPSFGIHTVGEIGDAELIGDWRGIMMQKNAAGPMCALAILTFLFDAKKIHWAIRAVVIVTAGFFLIQTASKTSMQVLAVCIVAGALYVRYNPRYRAFAIPLLMLAGVVGIILNEIYGNSLTQALDSRTGFTGRVQIWRPLWGYAEDHLLTGAGFGSFWNIGFHDGPIFKIATGWVTKVVHGHNGYLDLLVSVGLPGLLLVVFAAIIIPLVRIIASASAPRGAGALLLAILIFCAGHNLTESNIFDRDQPVQFYLMIAVAMIYQVTRATQRRRPPIPRPQRAPAGRLSPR